MSLFNISFFNDDFATFLVQMFFISIQLLKFIYVLLWYFKLSYCVHNYIILILVQNPVVNLDLKCVVLNKIDFMFCFY